MTKLFLCRIEFVHSEILSKVIGYASSMVDDLMYVGLLSQGCLSINVYVHRDRDYTFLEKKTKKLKNREQLKNWRTYQLSYDLM